MIVVPESVRYFHADRANKAALEMLADVNVLPDDIQWSELRTFVTARASAEQLKAELLLFLVDVWDNTWGAALRTLRPGAETPVMGEYEESLKPTITNCWRDRSVNNWSALDEGRWLMSAAWVEGDFPCVVKLGFYVQNADESNASTDINLGEGWAEVDDSGYRNSADGLALLGHREVDVTMMRALADSVLRRVLEK